MGFDQINSNKRRRGPRTRKKLQAQAADLQQQRIDAVPTRESDLTELSRDYPVLG